ncbi:MAG: M42 family peptidase, partial [Methanomicrobiales archaeon]|nr:M42 family peptidase [Methanomicrobiales archaeon]
MTGEKELLRKFADAHGVSGSEGNVHDVIRAEIQDHVDQVRIDKIGNLVAVKEGGDLSVMLAAHTDEIGLMVNYIDEKGFLRFVTFGGWYAPVLSAQRVILHGSKGPVHGVIGGKPPHAMNEEDRKKAPKIEGMFI